MSWPRTVVLCGFIITVGFITYTNYQKALSALDTYVYQIYNPNNISGTDSASSDLRQTLRDIGGEYSALE